jgi:tetratricopeptide (TPR) repeat protein
LICIVKKKNELNNLFGKIDCWKYEPENRPNIQKIVLTLKAIISPEQDNIINESFSGSENNLSEQYQTISDVIPVINEDENLSIDLNINVDFSSNDKPDIDTQENSTRLNTVEPKSSSSNTSIKVTRPDIDTLANSTKLNIVESKSSLSNTSIQVMDSSSKNSMFELKLEEDKFTTLDEKAKELIKKLTETKHLHALKLLFENLQNEFSPQILRDTLVALADPTPFDYYAKQSVARLELHLRTWVIILERICFSQMCLSKELQDKIYNSLTKFAEIYHKTLQVIEGFENNNFNFDQQNDNDSEKIVKNRNYNIEFLLIHLRDTLNSLRDDETWFQEIIRKTKELLKIVLNIVPGVLSATSENAIINDNCSIFSILTQLRQDLSFKYPVASYYIDWRIMLIIHYNLLTWSDSSEKIFNKKFGEMLLMEYIWGFLEREWNNVANKSILNSQNKFDESSAKLVKSFKNTGSFLSKPFALPNTLWFGILDLAQNLILKSTHTAIRGLGYYLAIESLNKAPSSFIQFKAIEILLHLYNINNQLFSIIELDFDHYAQNLKENNLIPDHFQNLLLFVKEICSKDFNILYNSYEINDNKEKRKGKEKVLDLIKHQPSNHNILSTIADEMTCPISSEPTDQLCILKCQHILSLINFKKLKQKNCPKCREKIEDNDIRFISQNTIYKNLYSYLLEAGYILPTIELEDSSNQYNSVIDNSEAELILTKKNKFIKAIKLNSNTISLPSIFPRISKKQHPIYQSAIKELNEKNYEKAEYFCKEFIKTFPTNYTMKCIIAYIYRCLNNYELAHLYLKDAINLKEKRPLAYFIRGEIFFRQSMYVKAILDLEKSLSYKAKINNLYIILGNSFLFDTFNHNRLPDALKNYIIALKNNPSNYLCLKNCAYIYDKLEDYSNALKILDKLLTIDKEDSLVLCYYGEILCKISQHNNAISYFTKANIIDPENIHNLHNRSIAYFILKEYDKCLLDLNKAIQLNPFNIITYCYKIVMLMQIIRLNYVYYKEKLVVANHNMKTMENVTVSVDQFEKCVELNHDFWSNMCNIYEMKDFNFDSLGIINKFNEYMYKGKRDLNLLFL